MSREISLVALLVDPVLRNVVCPYLDSSLFQDEAARIMYEALSTIEGRPSIGILTVILDKLEGHEDRPAVISALNNVKDPLSDSDIKTALIAFESHIQDRMVAKGMVKCHESGGVKSALPIFSEAASLDLRFKKSFDFSKREDVEAAYNLETSGESSVAVIESKYNVINRSLLFGGYRKRNLVLLTAKTGTGKTTFLVNEGVNFITKGFRVLHIALSDMTPYGLYVKYSACRTGLSCRDVALNPYQYIDDVMGNLVIECHPALSLDIDQLCGLVARHHRVNPVHVVFVDYDGNLVEKNENMYKNGGYTYSRFKGVLDINGMLGFMASQSKKEYWEDEVLPLEAPVESTRKQHATDIQIGLGRSQDYGEVGSMHLAKVREGKTGAIVRLKFDIDKSQITEIPAALYDQLKKEFKRLSSTDANVTVDNLLFGDNGVTRKNDNTQCGVNT
jgi:hypothetical protein